MRLWFPPHLGAGGNLCYSDNNQVLENKETPGIQLKWVMGYLAALPTEAAGE